MYSRFCDIFGLYNQTKGTRQDFAPELITISYNFLVKIYTRLESTIYIYIYIDKQPINQIKKLKGLVTFYLHKPIQQMSSTLNITIWVCWELTQCIKYLIEENNQIPCYNLHDILEWLDPATVHMNNNRTTRQIKPQYKGTDPHLTFPMLYKASHA